MNLFRRRSSRALVGSGHRPPLRIDFPQRNKHNNMQRAKSSFLKRHSLVSSFGFVASDLEQTTVRCKVCLKAAGTEGPSGQLLQTQSRCVPLKIWCPYIQWRRRFINMLKMFDPRFVLQSHNGACFKPEEADRLVFLAKNV